MSNMNELLDEAKRRLELTSDRQLANALKISSPSICLIRKGGGISGETARKLGKIIDVEPALIAIAALSETDHDKGFRDSCKRVLKEMKNTGHCILCKIKEILINLSNLTGNLFRIKALSRQTT